MSLPAFRPSSFLADYAEFYDLFYSDKNYDAECDFLEAIIRKYGARTSCSILDVACGTGEHALRMARRGYEVIGRDLSEAMVSIARRKADQLGLSIDLQGNAPMQTLDIGRQFDYVICLFSSFSYLLSNDDIRRALASVSRHLAHQGLFIFDFRNYLMAVRDFDPCRVCEFEQDGMRVIRISETQLLPLLNQMHTCYTCLVLNAGQQVKEFEEEHRLRYFSLEEMHYYLESSGFRALDFMPFMKLDEPVEETTWNIATVAQKC